MSEVLPLSYKSEVWKYSNLTESVITLPEGITEIGEYAFGQINIEDNVEQIILPDTVKVIKQGAFANRGKLKEINDDRDTYVAGHINIKEYDVDEAVEDPFNMEY